MTKWLTLLQEWCETQKRSVSMQKEMAIGIMKIVEQLEPRRGVQKENSTGEVRVIKFVDCHADRIHGGAKDRHIVYTEAEMGECMMISDGTEFRFGDTDRE